MFYLKQLEIVIGFLILAVCCSSSYRTLTCLTSSVVGDGVNNRSSSSREIRSCEFFLPNWQRTESNTNVKTLYIQGLFELTGSGMSELAAACLAIKHINQRQFIPGYRLDIYVNDTKGDSGVAVDAFFHALYCKPQSLMLLGTGMSQVTEQLAQIVYVWNLIQVSFGSTAPALSDRRSYPLFFRTVAPDSSHNAARVAFVKHFGWDAVAIISDDSFTLGINDLVEQLEKVNVSVIKSVVFTKQDFGDRLAQLKATDCRIIFASFTEELATNILCEVYHSDMHGGDYVWIFPENLSKNWWQYVNFGPQIHCTKKQLLTVMHGAFFVRMNNAIVGDEPSISQLTNEQFVEEFAKLKMECTDLAPQTYDAVWAIAITLRDASARWSSTGSSSRLEHFTYKREDMRQTFFDIMAHLFFQGISGRISFRGPDRVGVTSFHQNKDGEMHQVALYFPRENTLQFNCSVCLSIYWEGGQAPVARRTLKIYIKTVSWTAFVAVTIFASIGIFFAIVFLAFNLYYRKLKHIKLSSPKLNNMAAVGCVLVYSAVILLGVDHRMIASEEHFPVLCMSRAFLLSAGFSLAFGAMFTKTYRVHQIFIRVRSGVVKSKHLRDKRLIILVGALLLIDCFVVTLWTLVDPMQRHLRNLTIEISHSERDVLYQPQVEECKSVHVERWLGGLYVYKGLLLAVGVYMAWETRNVKIPALNDSQYIGMNVYNVVITSIIVVVIANLISEHINLTFVVVTSLIFASTTVTLCLLFVPKLHAICKYEDSDPIVESLGLRIESNTRRFVIDEKREQYYRAEVQNRVYKRELAELNQEVARLEDLLNNDGFPPKKVGSIKFKNKASLIGNEDQHLESLCASTLNHFLYDRVHLRRRSCDGPRAIDATSKDDRYASAIQSHIEHHRRQRKKRLKEYLPEIIVSSASEDFIAEDALQYQPLLHHRAAKPLPESLGFVVANNNSDNLHHLHQHYHNHHHHHHHHHDASRMLPWNSNKRMSFSVGFKSSRNDSHDSGSSSKCHQSGAKEQQQQQQQQQHPRKRSFFLGFLSKAGSEGVLSSSTTAATSSSLDELSLAIADVISRPASQSLLMLDFATAFFKCSESADGPRRSSTQATEESSADCTVDNSSSSFSSQCAKSDELAECRGFSHGTGDDGCSCPTTNQQQPFVLDSCIEVDDNEEAHSMSSSNNLNNNNNYNKKTLPEVEFLLQGTNNNPIQDSHGQMDKTEVECATTESTLSEEDTVSNSSVSLFVQKNVLDSKRKEIEDLRLKLGKLEVELKSLEEKRLSTTTINTIE